MRLWGRFSFETPCSVCLQQAPREHIVQLWASLRQSGFSPILSAVRSLYVTTVDTPVPVPCGGNPDCVLSTTPCQAFSPVHLLIPAALQMRDVLASLSFRSAKITMRFKQLAWHRFLVQISFMISNGPHRVLHTGGAAGSNRPSSLEKGEALNTFVQNLHPLSLHDSQSFTRRNIV